MKLLEGRVAIVTGAASGIGRAIALKFAEAGAVVVIADTREEAIEGGVPTAKLIRDASGQGFFWPTDVSQWADIDQLVTETVRLHGRLDVMVNNAATYTGTKLLETTEEQWNRVMAVNLTGMFFGCKRAVQQMLTQEPPPGLDGEARGRIVNISSQHGMIAAPGDCAYGVSKAGAVYLTRQVAADYAKDRIVCNAVAPGKILTGKPAIDSDPTRLAYARSRTPWPRLGQPNDVANAVLYLASDLASFVTGTNLMVDGGWMAA